MRRKPWNRSEGDSESALIASGIAAVIETLSEDSENLGDEAVRLETIKVLTSADRTDMKFRVVR